MKTVDKTTALTSKTDQTTSQSVEQQARLIKELSAVKAERQKRQKNNSFLFFTIGLCLSLSMVIMAFELQFSEKKEGVKLAQGNFEDNNIIDIPVTEQPPPPPPKVQQPKVVEVANDEEIIEEIEFTLDVEVTEETKIEENTQLVLDEEPEEEVADEIFTIVENQPEPAGGFAAFYTFVSDNLRYPEKALRMGIEGKVFVQFVVERDGTLTDVQAVKGIGAGCDEEAVRIVSAAPKWNPGKQRGKPVRVRMILPIQFKIYPG